MLLSVLYCGNVACNAGSYVGKRGSGIQLVRVTGGGPCLRCRVDAYIASEQHKDQVAAAKVSLVVLPAVFFFFFFFFGVGGSIPFFLPFCQH